MWAASQGAFEGSDIALDGQEVAGCSARQCPEPGKAGVFGSIPRRSTITSQMEADALLAEHRAVMAAHYRDCLTRPTEERYEALLSELRGVWSCPVELKELSA